MQALLQVDEAAVPALTADDLRRIGLPVVDAAALAAPMQDALQALQSLVGPASQRSGDDAGGDALFATADGGQRRRQRPHAPSGVWEQAA